MADVPPLQTDSSSSGPNYGKVPPTPPVPPLPGAPPSGIGTLTVQSPNDLMNAATSQVDSEIAGQVTPLEANVNTLLGQEDQTRQNINDLFGNLLPYVAGSAQRVEGSYDAAEGAQANIMAAANQRLSQLKQSRAQEAQALAQEMGGPVSLGEFTAGLDDQASLLATLGAGQQLHTLAYGQADVGEANAFAGRVMPLVQVEQQAKARQYYEDQVKNIREQITSLKGQRGSKVNAAYNDLLVKEREFALQKAQQGLDKVKASHDWSATLRTLKNDDARLKLAQREQSRQEAETSGLFKGKPTLAAKQLTMQEKNQAEQLGLSEKDYQLRKQQLQTSTKQNNTRLNAATKSTWAQYLDAAVNPQPGKTIRTSQAVPITAAQAFKDKSAYKDPSSPTGYSKLVTTVQTPVAQAITNPSDLVDYLVAHNVPKTVAIRMVRSRLQIPDWKYGTRDPHGRPAAIPDNETLDHAIARMKQEGWSQQQIDVQVSKWKARHKK